MELYYGDQLCSKCIRKRFVSFQINKIHTYKYNILMTLQSAIASTVTVIAGILVYNVWCKPGLSWKGRKGGGRGNFSGSWTKVAGNCMKLIDLVSGFFPCLVMGGGGLFCQLNQSCWKLHEIDWSSLWIFSLFGHLVGFSARLSMWCSIMHEIWFSKVTSHDTMQTRYLTKRKKVGGGGFSADLNQPGV